MFPKKPDEPATGGEQEDRSERVEQPRGTEAAILRERLNAAQDQLRREREERDRERATWERERETILERERAASDYLQKRLDKAEERILALSAPQLQETPQNRANGSGEGVTANRPSKGLLGRLWGR